MVTGWAQPFARTARVPYAISTVRPPHRPLRRGSGPEGGHRGVVADVLVDAADVVAVEGEDEHLRVVEGTPVRAGAADPHQGDDLAPAVGHQRLGHRPERAAGQLH